MPIGPGPKGPTIQCHLRKIVLNSTDTQTVPLQPLAATGNHSGVQWALESGLAYCRWGDNVNNAPAPVIQGPYRLYLRASNPILLKHFLHDATRNTVPVFCSLCTNHIWTGWTNSHNTSSTCEGYGAGPVFHHQLGHLPAPLSGLLKKAR